MVLVGFVVIDHALQHGFQDTIYGFFLAIELRVVGCCKLMDKNQGVERGPEIDHFTNTYHGLILIS